MSFQRCCTSPLSTCQASSSRLPSSLLRVRMLHLNCYRLLLVLLGAALSTLSGVIAPACTAAESSVVHYPPSYTAPSLMGYPYGNAIWASMTYAWRETPTQQYVHASHLYGVIEMNPLDVHFGCFVAWQTRFADGRYVIAWRFGRSWPVGQGVIRTNDPKVGYNAFSEECFLHSPDGPFVDYYNMIPNPRYAPRYDPTIFAPNGFLEWEIGSNVRQGLPPANPLGPMPVIPSGNQNCTACDCP